MAKLAMARFLLFPKDVNRLCFPAFFRYLRSQKVNLNPFILYY